MAKRGRKEINPNDKMTLVRVFTEKYKIDTIGEDVIKQKVNELINQLQEECKNVKDDK